jgi:hypothetical protein
LRPRIGATIAQTVIDLNYALALNADQPFSWLQPTPATYAMLKDADGKVVLDTGGPVRQAWTMQSILARRQRQSGCCSADATRTRHELSFVNKIKERLQQRNPSVLSFVTMTIDEPRECRAKTTNYAIFSSPNHMRARDAPGSWTGKRLPRWLDLIAGALFGAVPLAYSRASWGAARQAWLYAACARA